MCGASSARSPASTLMTPPARSLVAMISEKVRAGSAFVVETRTTAQLPLKITGMTSGNETEQRRLVGTNHNHDTGRLGRCKIEVRARDRIHRAKNLGEFVSPARVVHQSVDCERRF